MLNPSGKPAVLFLCTKNSCRSQMAEGLLRHFGSERYEAFSAGTDPAVAVHPLAVEAMSEMGIDISHQRPKDVGEYLGRLSVRQLVIVCQEAEAKCPRMFPGMMSRSFWPLDDPASFVGSAEATAQKFRMTRDELATRINEWLRESP